MGVAAIMVVIYWSFYLVVLAVFAPIGMIWQNIWRNPKPTATMALTAVSAILVSVYFNLPWQVLFKFVGFPVTAFEVANFLAQTGPLVASVIFLVVWLSVPVTIFILLKTTISFSRAHPSFFIGRMLAGFAAALYGYATTGFVPIKIAFYGIGALIVLFCIKTIARDT